MMKKRSERHKKNYLKTAVVLTCLIIIGVLLVLIVKENQTNKNHEQTSQKNSSIHKTVKKKVSLSSAKKATSSDWLTARLDNQLPILMFHYASSNPSDLTDSNWMPDATLNADLAALKNAGYVTVTAAEAEKILTTRTKPSNKMVWLTFDDGSLTVYRDIFPLLKKYHMHATAFIITGFVDNNQSGILNWQQIKEMKASGLVDFQSHTVSHLDLGTLSTSEATYQLEQSKKELDQQLGQNTNIICYPAGGYNQETLQLAQHLGYQFGLLDPGRNGAVAEAASAADGLLTLPRFRMMSTTNSQDLMRLVTSSTQYNIQNTVK